MDILPASPLLEKLPDSSRQFPGEAVEGVGRSCWMLEKIRPCFIGGQAEAQGEQQPRPQGSLATALISGNPGALVFGPSRSLLFLGGELENSPSVLPVHPPLSLDAKKTERAGR